MIVHQDYCAVWLSNEAIGSFVISNHTMESRTATTNVSSFMSHGSLGKRLLSPAQSRELCR
jgi:hypothetical protein